MNVNPAAIEQQQRIGAIRKATGVKEPRLHHVPRWFKKAVKPLKLFGDGGVVYGSPWWLDHWGSIEKGTAFVSEPYGLSAKVAQEAIDFAKAAGLELTFDADSWWNPPCTIRLTFRLPKA